MKPALLEKARGIRLAVFDVDGVMTDGRLFFTDSGEEIKAFHVRDGLGLKALMKNGIEVAVITARTAPLVERRMSSLGIRLLMQGREDKAAALAELLDTRSLEASAIAYAGDDLVDWPAMRHCGLKCAPADADERIRQRADFVSALPGGAGAVREICELILAGHGKLADWQDSFQ